MPWISEGRPVIVNGDGQQFTYAWGERSQTMDDVARGMLVAQRTL
ncbi:MAG: hypothetical protein AMXMBFR16_11740 [Candidatus Uhrbacteria bacterium]